MTVRLVVTTSWDADPQTCDRAKALARRFDLPFVERESLPTAEVEGAGARLVVLRRGVALEDASGRYVWSPGIAQLRLKTLEAGQPDTLVEVAGFRPGEVVLDGTLGLAQDALVAARAVGPGGRVVGIEKSLPLFAVVSEGLAARDPGPSSARIEPVLDDLGRFLRAQPDASFDVVMIDPMFGRPRKAQPGFDFVRRYGEHAPLTREVLDEAIRVARRVVVVKGARYSDDLWKLGLTPLQRSRYADVVWARIEPPAR